MCMMSAALLCTYIRIMHETSIFCYIKGACPPKTGCFSIHLLFTHSSVMGMGFEKSKERKSRRRGAVFHEIALCIFSRTLYATYIFFLRELYYESKESKQNFFNCI